MKKTIMTAALAAMMCLPTFGQDSPVRINGSLIDWYYFGRDYTGSTSGDSWNQMPTGGGAWIDSLGVGHSTGEANYGLLSLIPDPGTDKPLKPEFLIRNHILYSNCGGLYMGGNEYYSFFGHEVDASSNIDGEYGSEEYEILVRKWTWNVDPFTGAYVDVQYENVGRLNNQPTDLAYDPYRDIVYGVFSLGGGDGYKLGTLDMKTFKVSWISREAMPLTGELRTLACNSKGELYGTDKSGNIYHVDNTNGALTVIGHMTMNGEEFRSQEKMVSATFDYRTDKMYWLGYVNDGKKSADTSGTNNTLTIAEGGRDTGLFEIDIVNGKAESKLIALTNFADVEMEYDENGVLTGAHVNRYGKMEMTGIYVEGSIIKPDYDLSVTIKSYPGQMTTGQKSSDAVVASVKNVGTKRIKGSKFTVSLYAGQELLATIDDSDDEIYTDNLDPGESQELPFYFTAPTGIAATTVNLRVVVDCELDERADNNFADCQVRVLSGEILPPPVISGFTYETEQGTAVELRWSNPRGHYTEGAEDFVPFSYDNLGAWMVYDGDKGYTQKANNWNASIEYPNWSTPKAFIVMDPWKAGFDLAVGGEKFAPHSGSQYFAAWWTAVPDDSEAGGHQIANDDWLISPQLSGIQQTIKFWAKGYKGIETEEYQTEMNLPELMRVLATKAEYTSVEDFNRDDWEVITEAFQVSNTEWTEYSAVIPTGYQHFALQCCSEEGFVLMLDDISFDVPVREVTGYSIYANGLLCARNTASTNTYTAYGITETTAFTVTANYNRQESAHSNVFYVTKEVRGDVNGDKIVDVADIATIIQFMSRGIYNAEADVNGDGVIDVADIATVITVMSSSK